MYTCICNSTRRQRLASRRETSTAAAAAISTGVKQAKSKQVKRRWSWEDLVGLACQLPGIGKKLRKEEEEQQEERKIA